jgi:hypothetical protein
MEFFKKEVFKKSKFAKQLPSKRETKKFRNHKIGDRPVTVYLGDRWGFACAGSVVQASHSSHTESLRSERERRNEGMKAQQGCCSQSSFPLQICCCCRVAIPSGIGNFFGKRL